MASATPKMRQFRCRNKYGRPSEGIEKCRDYGSKGFPNDLVTIEESKLPPAGIAPKCPCCKQDLVEDPSAAGAPAAAAPRPSGTATRPGVPTPRRRSPLAAIAVAIVVLLLGGFLLTRFFSHPTMRLGADRIAINSVHPSQALAITNTGSRTLHVTISSGRDAIQAQPASVDVKAGATQEVQISIQDSASKVTRVDTVLDLSTDDPAAKKKQVNVAWRNVGALLSEKFDQVHGELYR